MNMLVLALILGLVFGLLAGFVVFVGKGEFSPSVWVVAGGGFVAGFLVTLIGVWFSMPTWGTVILMCFLIGGIGIIALLRLFSRSFGRLGRRWETIVMLVVAGGLLVTSSYFGLSSTIWRGYDTAKYFDSILEFPDEKLPFNNIIEGENLRVVDSDLAAEIIQKSSPFGSNSMI
ncbi:MAG: hypothetical protein HGN29_17960, partial [Asgard group archaeon]|nr:hypothetical protein [Asgard group archaeon]